jgi:hypothetical protein
MKERASEINKQSKDNKTEIRVQAVFAILKGEGIRSVSERFGVCRDTLYQLRRRAIAAVRREIEIPIERKCPAHNRLSIVWWSSFSAHKTLSAPRFIFQI